MSDPLCTISVFCLRKSQQIISGGAEGDAKMQKRKSGNVGWDDQYFYAVCLERKADVFLTDLISFI